MTKQEFITAWADLWKIPKAFRHDDGVQQGSGGNFVAMACRCEHPGCKGWVMVPDYPAAIEMQKEKYS